MSQKDYLNIPALVKHVTQAVYGKLRGTHEQRVINAFAIARGKLVQSGYLNPGSIEGPVTAISLTPQGVERNKKHKAEWGKSASFDSMISILEQAWIAEQSIGVELAADAPQDSKVADRQIEKIIQTKKPVQRSPHHNPPPGSQKVKSRVDRVKIAKVEKAAHAKTSRARKA
jgi:hypothetical protein